MDDVDLIIATLEHAMGSIGGFCVGTSYVVEHQTLAGLGYCFSASLPPMLAAGAMKSLEILENNPGIIEELSVKCELVHSCFENLHGLELHGHRRSPIKHLRIKRPEKFSKEEQKMRLQELVNMVD